MSPIRLSKDTKSNLLLYEEIGDPYLEEKLTASEVRAILQKNKLTEFYNMNDQSSLQMSNTPIKSLLSPTQKKQATRKYSSNRNSMVKQNLFEEQSKTYNLKAFFSRNQMISKTHQNEAIMSVPKFKKILKSIFGDQIDYDLILIKHKQKQWQNPINFKDFLDLLTIIGKENNLTLD